MENYLRRLYIVSFLVFAFSSSQLLAENTGTCKAVESKLFSLNDGECSQYSWSLGPQTPNGNDLLYLDIEATDEPAQASRILLIGGIHGDEFSSVTIAYKWLSQLEKQLYRRFNWRFIPAANPDGLLRNPAVRYNANGIDLNRNFPTKNWQKNAAEYWQRVGRDKRRYPGEVPASETETQWLIGQIESYNPDVIIAIHAPYHLLDFDGPPLKPMKLGPLSLRQLGVYPGSLGNYGSLCLSKQVVTLELPTAGTMPKQDEVKRMWRDLVRWLANNEAYQRSQHASRQYQIDEQCR